MLLLKILLSSNKLNLMSIKIKSKRNLNRLSRVWRKDLFQKMFLRNMIIIKILLISKRNSFLGTLMIMSCMKILS